MSPLTSPDDHSLVKPAPSISTEDLIYESDSNIDDIEGINSEAVALFWDINNEQVSYPSHKPEFMEMDETYVHNIEIPLAFTYGAEPESLLVVSTENWFLNFHFIQTKMLVVK